MGLGVSSYHTLYIYVYGRHWGLWYISVRVNVCRRERRKRETEGYCGYYTYICIFYCVGGNSVIYFISLLTICHHVMYYIILYYNMFIVIRRAYECRAW